MNAKASHACAARGWPVMAMQPRAERPLVPWRDFRHHIASAAMTGHLLRRGVDLDVVLEPMLAWNRSHCRPTLSDAEVARVVHGIERQHGQGEATADGEHP